MTASVGAGLIILGCVTGILGTVAAFNYPKFKEDSDTQAQIIDEEGYSFEDKTTNTNGDDINV